MEAGWGWTACGLIATVAVLLSWRQLASGRSSRSTAWPEADDARRPTPAARAQQLSPFAIPEAEGIFRVPSSSDPRHSYQVDLATLTCTCPDHERRRRGTTLREVGRCCKHLARLLLEQGILHGAHPLALCVLEEERRGRMLALIDIGLADPCAVGSSGNGWVNVWTRGRKIKGRPGPYQRYEWSAAENRWARGDTPPGATRLIPAIRRLLAEREPAQGAARG